MRTLCKCAIGGLDAVVAAAGWLGWSGVYMFSSRGREDIKLIFSGRTSRWVLFAVLLVVYVLESVLNRVFFGGRAFRERWSVWHKICV